MATLFLLAVAAVAPVQSQALKSAEDYFDRGNMHFRDGELAAAVEHYRKAVELAPENFQYVYNLAIALRDLGEVNGARDAFIRATELKPENPYAHYHLGVMSAKSGDFMLAVNHLKKAADINLDDTVLYYLGTAYQGMYDYENARKAYQRTVKLNPANFGAWYSLGQLRYYDGDSAGAIEAYDRAIEIDPDASMVYVNIGIAQMSEGRLEKALELFDTSISLEPDNFYGLYHYGDALIKQGNPGDAVTYLKRAISVDPTRATPVIRLAEAYEALERREEAVDQYLRVLEMSPGNGRASMNLFNLLDKQEQPPRLRAWAEFIDSSGDGVLGSDEDAYLRVNVKNIGRGDAHMIEVGVVPQGSVDTVTVGPDKTIRSIAPEETGVAEIRLHGRKDLLPGEAVFRVHVEELHDFNVETPLEITVKLNGM